MRAAGVIAATVGAVMASSIIASATSDDGMSAAEFFRRDQQSNWRTSLSSVGEYRPLKRALNASKMRVRQMVINEARRQGVNVDAAVRIAYIESRFRCNAVGPRTRYGRAIGVMQVLPSSARALGFNPHHLRDCMYGIRAGIAHMVRCRDTWAGNDAKKLARCHVGGWARPVRTRYANEYVASVSGERRAHPRYRTARSLLRKHRYAKRTLRRKLIRLARR